jgi:hypothetical protein
MPAQEVTQPQPQQMEMHAQDAARVSSEQPVGFPPPPIQYPELTIRSAKPSK